MKKFADAFDFSQLNIDERDQIASNALGDPALSPEAIEGILLSSGKDFDMLAYHWVGTDPGDFNFCSREDLTDKTVSWLLDHVAHVVTLNTTADTALVRWAVGGLCQRRSNTDEELYSMYQVLMASMNMLTGTEIYLRGKRVPTVRLQNAFGEFRNLFTQIYNHPNCSEDLKRAIQVFLQQ